MKLNQAKIKAPSTCYIDNLIEVVKDTKAFNGNPPPTNDMKTFAEMQFDLISSKLKNSPRTKIYLSYFQNEMF